MDEKEPYKHAKLTLAELAGLMETNSHTLSRVINEGYKKNFYELKYLVYESSFF